MGGAPHPMTFLNLPPHQTDAPMGHPLLKMNPQLKNNSPSLKSEAPFQEMIPKKN